MPDGYPGLSLPVTAEELLDLQNDQLQARMPDFQPAAGGADTWEREALATTGAAVIAKANEVSAFTFASLGALDGRPPRQAVPASGVAQFTSAIPPVDDIPALPVTVRAGTPLLLTTSDGAQVELVVAEETTGTGTFSVPLVTIPTGSAYNDLSGVLRINETVPELDETPVLTGVLAGGADGETPEEYLDALTALRALSTPRPVKASEFAAFALEDPAVGGCVVIDLLNPETEETDARATSTVVVWDPHGDPLLEASRLALQARLRAIVEQHFDVFVIDADYTDLDVQAAGTAVRTYSTTYVAARLQAAIRAHLDPFAWGLVPTGDRRTQTWRNRTVVTYLDLASDLGPLAVQGLEELTSLTIGLHGGSLGTSNITLAGVAPRPRVVTVTVNVTAGSA